MIAGLVAALTVTIDILRICKIERPFGTGRTVLDAMPHQAYIISLSLETAAGTLNLSLKCRYGKQFPREYVFPSRIDTGVRKVGLSQASSRTGALDGVTRMGIVPIRAPLQSRAFLALSYLANSTKAMLVER